MRRPYFMTPQEAEAAFYDALARNDLELMMAIWSEDEEVVCTHPGGVRLIGSAAVRESWRQAFSQAQPMQIRCSGQVLHQGLLLAVSHLEEQLIVAGRTYPPLAATNVYLRGGDGWRMLSHHASALPGGPGSPEEVPDILH